MRFMLMVRANQDTEAGIPPTPEIVTKMMAFNEEMVKAGVLLAGDGLHPSSRGAMVRFSGGKHRVIDGPYAEAKELIAGFWIIQAGSLAEAVAWASRVPSGDDHLGGELAIEVRQLFDMSDFPDDVRAVGEAKEGELKAEMARQQAARS